MRTYFAVLFVLINGISFSQQKDSLRTDPPRFIVKMTHGMTSSVSFDFTPDKWGSMTPGFEIPDSLKPNENGVYFHDNTRVFTSGAYYMFTFSFINGKDKQANRRFLSTTNLHLGYGPEMRATKYWYHENKQVVDTLISNQTGQQYFVSGNRNQTIAKTYRSQTIALGVGQHIATNPNRIFQFETGVDVMCLLSVGSEVAGSYIDSYEITGLPYDSENAPGYPYPSTLENRRENFSGNFMMGLLVRVPLEMSFKLSRNNPVLSRMRIGGELNPGMATVFAGGLISSNINFSGGMNFRFAF